MTYGGVLWLSIPMGPAIPDTAADYDGHWTEGELMHDASRPYIGTGGIGVGLTGLFTYETGGYGNAMGNLGVASFSQEVDDPILGTVSSSDFAIDVGLGYEYWTSLAAFYTEVCYRAFPGRGSDPGYSAPAWFMLGMRLYENNGAWMDLALQKGLSSHDRDNNDLYETGYLAVPGGVPGEIGVLIDMGWDSGLSGGGSAAEGRIGGIVTDAATGNPLAATVTFSQTRAQTVSTDPTTGFYSAEVGPGLVVVRVEAEGYSPATSTVAVPEHGSAAADFELSPTTPATGTVTGVITDSETGRPLQATITAQGSGISATSGADGRFSMDLPSGSWTLVATSEGRNQGMTQVQVNPGNSVPVSISLSAALETGQVMSFANIYFDSGSAVLKTESYPVLDGVANLLIANPGARIEVSGHTDSQGSESSNQSLSERRAASVRDYLVSRGVAASMLTTAGYGESRPVASNDTADGRARNRRIEFTVL
jgi:outer membrane protein OmpA-like peptidoglycan-associated protein